MDSGESSEAGGIMSMDSGVEILFPIILLREPLAHIYSFFPLGHLFGAMFLSGETP